MFKRKRSKRTVGTLIGAGTRIDGDVEFAGGLHLDGYIGGNVSARPGPDAFLSVSREGCIEGSVSAPDVIVNGIVKGDIVASGRVQLGAAARVLGNVQYALIESAVGAQINGKLIHRTDSGDGGSGPAGAAGAAEGTLIGHRQTG